MSLPKKDPADERFYLVVSVTSDTALNEKRYVDLGQAVRWACMDSVIMRRDIDEYFIKSIDGNGVGLGLFTDIRSMMKRFGVENCYPNNETAYRAFMRTLQ